MPPNEPSTSPHPCDAAGEDHAPVDKSLSLPLSSANELVQEPMEEQSQVSQQPIAALLSPRLMKTPPGYPPELLGRGLSAAEFFHIFGPILANAEVKAANADAFSREDAPERPSAWGFMSALAGTDLASFFRVCRYLKVLLNCLRTRRPGAAEVPPVKKRHIMELVWRELAAPFANSCAESSLKSRGSNNGRQQDAIGARASIKRKEYSQISVLNRLALFEGLMHYIVELPDVSKWVPKARLEPLALDWDGSRLWAMSCAPDRVMAEMRSPLLAAETWRCYDTPEALKALRLAAGSEAKLVEALDRIIEINQSEISIREQVTPESSIVGAEAWVVDPVFEYQRSKFTSRLIGCAELLNLRLSHGSCMSMHRLRHYLVGSTRLSELADSLLQFERHLKPQIRLSCYEGKIWRRSVLECETISGLNLLLDDLLLGHQPLAQYLGDMRAVCARCHQPVTAGKARQLAFCFACCFNYHRECIVRPVDNGPSVQVPNAAPTSTADIIPATGVTTAIDVTPDTDDTPALDITVPVDVIPAVNISPSVNSLRNTEAAIDTPGTSMQATPPSVSADLVFHGLWKCADCLKPNQTDVGKAGISNRNRKRTSRPSVQPQEPCQPQPQHEQEQAKVREQGEDILQDEPLKNHLVEQAIVTLEEPPAPELSPSSPFATYTEEAKSENVSEISLLCMEALSLACPSTTMDNFPRYCDKVCIYQADQRQAVMTIDGIYGVQTCQSNAAEDENGGSAMEASETDEPTSSKKARPSNGNDEPHTP